VVAWQIDNFDELRRTVDRGTLRKIIERIATGESGAAVSQQIKAAELLLRYILGSAPPPPGDLGDAGTVIPVWIPSWEPSPKLIEQPVPSVVVDDTPFDTEEET
jgi:hypothetical protein